MKEIKENVRQKLEFYRTMESSSLILNDALLFHRSKELLNHEYLHYPFMDHIYICHDFSRNGIYERIYWLDEMWQKTEDPVWKYRIQLFGVSDTSRRCSFYTTRYKRNTLLNPDHSFLDKNWLHICRDRFSQAGMADLLEEISQFRPDWIQVEEGEALLLLKAAENYPKIGFTGLQYIELLNSWDLELKQKLRQRFSCPVRRAFQSSLFGWTAFENEADEMELLTSNLSILIKEDVLLLSTTINTVMPVLDYQTECSIYMEGENLKLLQKEPVGSPLLLLKNGEQMCSALFKRPVEFINERVGRILNQVQILQENPGQFSVTIGMNPSYWGWKEEVQKLFIEYLSVPELEEAEYSFSFEKDLLKEKVPFFVNVAKG